MIRAKVVFYNSDTGEIIEEYDKAIVLGRKPFTDRGFVKIFVTFLRDILEIEEMGSGAWRLLLYVVDKMDYNSLEVYLDPRIVPKELGISRATFYNWLKVLTKHGILQQVDKRLFRLKPYSAIKGQMDKVIDF
jgi:CRP-like cAMP-binding protein